MQSSLEPCVGKPQARALACPPLLLDAGDGQPSQRTRSGPALAQPLRGSRLITTTTCKVLSLPLLLSRAVELRLDEVKQPTGDYSSGNWSSWSRVVHHQSML